MKKCKHHKLQKLTQELNNSNVHALRTLFEEYGDELTYMAHSIVGDMAAAEEITDDIFIRFWELGHKTFGSIEEIYEWMSLEAKQDALAFRKAKEAKAFDEEYYLASLEPGTAYNLSLGQEDLLVYAKMLKGVKLALDGLGEQQQTVIILGLDGLSTAQIAKVMNISPQTVRNYRVKAIENIRKRFPRAR
jgi:RNA polymerase sigma factor (sigma-70 family)